MLGTPSLIHECETLLRNLITKIESDSMPFKADSRKEEMCVPKPTKPYVGTLRHVRIDSFDITIRIVCSMHPLCNEEVPYLASKCDKKTMFIKHLSQTAIRAATVGCSYRSQPRACPALRAATGPAANHDACYSQLSSVGRGESRGKRKWLQICGRSTRPGQIRLFATSTSFEFDLYVPLL